MTARITCNRCEWEGDVKTPIEGAWSCPGCEFIHRLRHSIEATRSDRSEGASS